MWHAAPAADEPPHAHEIEDADPEPIPHAVIRRAGVTRAVDHVNICNVVAFPPGQRRQKPVQAVEIGQRKKEVAAERLEAAAGIAGTVTQHGAPDAIGQPRLELLEAGGLAADPLTCDESHLRGSRSERVTQRRNEGRIVLAVTIEGDDDVRPGMPHAGAYRSRLSA